MTVLGVVKNGHARCPQCRYMRPVAAMVLVPGGTGRYRCADEARCLRNVAKRDSLDRWKRRP